MRLQGLFAVPIRIHKIPVTNEQLRLPPPNTRPRRGLPFGNSQHEPGPAGQRIDISSVYLMSEVKNYVPAGLYPLGSPRFMDIWESRWTPATAMCPCIRQSTDAWARASLEAMRRSPGTREMMWHRGKVLGLIANRLNHMGAFVRMTDALSKAIVLLVQIELTCDNADKAVAQLQELKDLADQISSMERHGLDQLIKECMLVYVPVFPRLAYLSEEFIVPARRPF